MLAQRLDWIRHKLVSFHPDGAQGAVSQWHRIDQSRGSPSVYQFCVIGREIGTRTVRANKEEKLPVSQRINKAAPFLGI